MVIVIFHSAIERLHYRRVLRGEAVYECVINKGPAGFMIPGLKSVLLTRLF